MLTSGQIYVVATPIGNLGDMSSRALATLQAVDQVWAEDTRRTHQLLNHFQIKRPLFSLHGHNEIDRTDQILAEVEQGRSIALVSDAGTPLINDPGFRLIRAAHQKKIQVLTVPGPCSVIAALSISGLPTDRFIFEGFLPARGAARISRLQALSQETRTLIFFEAPHRIEETLQDMGVVLGELREATVARELTKTFESTHLGTLSEHLQRVQSDPNQKRGEFVLMVSGAPQRDETSITPEAEKVLKILLEEFSKKQASDLASKITGIKKRILYEYAVNKLSS